MNETVNPKFESWAILQLFGFRRDAGWVKAVYMGNVVMFSVTREARSMVESVTDQDEYLNHRSYPAGTRIRREAIPAAQYLIGGAAIYQMTPCSEEEARKAIEEEYPQTVTILSVPDGAKVDDGIPF